MKTEDAMLPAERNFALEMRRHREELGMSQAEMLQQLRAGGLDYLNQTALSRIENCSRKVRLIEAQSIAQILGLTIESMMQPSEILGAAETLLRYIDRAEAVRSELHERALDLTEAADEVRKRLGGLAVMLSDGANSDDLPPTVGAAINRGDDFMRSVRHDIQSPWVTKAAEQASVRHYGQPQAAH